MKTKVLEKIATVLKGSKDDFIKDFQITKQFAKKEAICMINRKDFDFYISNKINAALPGLGADLFGLYATCNQLGCPELKPLGDALKKAHDAIEAVYIERDKIAEAIKIDYWTFKPARKNKEVPSGTSNK